MYTESIEKGGIWNFEKYIETLQPFEIKPNSHKCSSSHFPCI